MSRSLLLAFLPLALGSQVVSSEAATALSSEYVQATITQSLGPLKTYYATGSSNIHTIYNDTGPLFVNGTAGGARTTGIGGTGVIGTGYPWPTGGASSPSNRNGTFRIVASGRNRFRHEPINARNGILEIGLPPILNCPNGDDCPVIVNETVYEGGHGRLDLVSIFYEPQSSFTENG